MIRVSVLLPVHSSAFLEDATEYIVLALFESILLGAASPVLLNENKGVGD